MRLCGLIVHIFARVMCHHVCVFVSVRVFWQSGAECDCADLFVGPLPWQSGAACGCADLFVTPRVCVCVCVFVCV